MAYSVLFFKVMTEHTAPDLTEMNSFGVLVVTISEHFELSPKSDNSARRAVITPRTRLNSVKLPVEYCSGGSARCVATSEIRLFAEPNYKVGS